MVVAGGLGEEGGKLTSPPPFITSTRRTDDDTVSPLSLSHFPPSPKAHTWYAQAHGQ